MAKIEIQGKDETGVKHTPFVDPDGKLRTGIVEYIKLIAQNPTLDGVTVGTGTASPTTYNTVLTYPLPLHSNDVGNDYTETTLTVTAAAGSTASRTGSASATFVSNLRNKLVKVAGDVIAKVTYYYVTDGAQGTVTIDSIDVEFGKIDTESGTQTAIASKSITVNRSTTNSAITEALTAFLQDQNFSLAEGERLYLKITVNFTLTVDATGSTVAITRTATVKIDHYRGTDDTHILVPVVM